MAGTIEYFDEKYSIPTISMLSNEYKDFKPKAESASFNFLLLLTIMFLFRLKHTLDKNRISYMIFLGFLKVLTLHLYPIDVFHELRHYSFNDEFFSLEILQMIDKINLYKIGFDSVIYTISEKKCVHQPPLSNLLLLLSGDLELNPGPNQACNTWSPFANKGLHFVHLNINSILPKIDELRQIVKTTNAAIIGITESKLDSAIFDTEISIEGYNIIRKDRNRHGGGVVCYIRNDICFNIIDVFPFQIESIFIDILFPKTKPFTVGIFYRPPDQNDFLEIISHDFSKLSTDKKEIYILGDININTVINGKSIFGKNKNIGMSEFPIPTIAKQYYEFCSMFSLKQ